MRKMHVVLAIVLLVPLNAGAQNRSTPEATVRSFVSALESGDLKQAAACVAGAKLSDARATELERALKADPIKVELSEVTSKVNGSQAVVKAHFVLHSIRRTNSQAGDTVVKLTSDKDTWRIVPDNSFAKNQRSFDLVNYVVYMLANPASFDRSRDAARMTTCLSNVKQLCLCVLMLANDNDETVKLTTQNWRQRLMPYAMAAGVFHCPSDSKPGNSYALNAKLAGIKLAKVRMPATTIMLYEGSQGKLAFRHDGRTIVGFADGHAKIVKRADAAKLRWNP